MDLTKHRLNEEIVRSTAERIKVDFEKFGLLIHFSGKADTAYTELMSQLVPFLESLLKTNKAMLMQVLYRIDISEDKLHKQTARNPDVPLCDVIGFLVIEREMQKVLSRKYFSEKK